MNWSTPCRVQLKFVQKALKERGIDTMLDEARENNRDYDRDNLNKG